MPRASDYLSDPSSIELRRTMVDRQLRTFDVTAPEVLAAALQTPREPFLNGEIGALVYSDAALEARAGQARRRLLAPMFVARALQSAEIGPRDRVLDVAGGPGYSAALAARLAGSVTAIEEDDAFVARASDAFEELGLTNATAIRGDLAAGPAGDDVFDVILVNGAVEQRPEGLLGRLADGGRLLAVEAGAGGARGAARFVLFGRSGEAISRRVLFGAAADTLKPFLRPPAFVF